MQLCASSLALAAAGCRRDRAQRVESTLTVFYSLEIGENIFLNGSGQWLVFEPLVKTNAKGELEGRLARSWEHSADYRTWTIHLRPDVTWQDGRPVTAHDIKFSLDLMMNPDVLLETPGAFSVTVLDDSTYTIIYHLEAGGASGTGSPMAVDNSPFCYPQHLLENLDPKTFGTWDFWRHPVGNGPYRVVRQVPLTMTEFEANPMYYRGRPRIGRVVLKGLTAESALTELSSGHVQAIWLDGKDLPTIRRDRRFMVYYTIQNFLCAIVWQHGHPLFREASVRRALTLAINRRELHQVLNLPDETPILDVTPSARQFRRGEFPDPLPYDPGQAKRLLDEARWREVDGGAVRERGGKPFRFVALAEQGQPAAAAVYIQAQLRSLGIQMDVQTMDPSAVRAREKTGEFEALIVSRVNTNTDPRRLTELFGEDSPLGYINPRVITLLGKARSTMDPDEIDRIYHELMPIFQAEVPVTILFPHVSYTVVSRHVRGLSSPYRADMVAYMEELWLEERR